MFLRNKPGRTLVPVYLEDIAEKLEEASDHWEQYLNAATGEFEYLPDGEYVEPDKELAERIDASDDYLRLPNQYDIHEYRIMESFAESVRDSSKSSRLFRALRGRKPYRHFKDEIIYLDLDQAYYAFRSRAFMEIAREWCKITICLISSEAKKRHPAMPTPKPSSRHPSQGRSFRQFFHCLLNQKSARTSLKLRLIRADFS